MSPDPTAASRAAQRALVLYLPALLMLAYATYAGTLTRDGDIYFHIAAGRWIAQHLQFIHRDVLSYSAAGTKWDDPEWLSELLAAGAYRLAGWSGVALLFASAAALTLVLLSRQLLKFLAPLPALIVMQFALGIVASNLSSRPYVLALPLLAVWTDGLLTARQEERTPSLWLLPLMVLWANLHGSFLFGIALIAPFAAEAFFAAGDSRWRTALSWAGFAAASVVAAAINPNGIYGLIDPILFTLKPVLAIIGDWQSSTFNEIGAFEVSLLALLALALSRPVRLPLFRLLLLLLLVHMTFAHRRHASVFAIVAPMILAAPIAQAFARNGKVETPMHVPTIADVAAMVSVVLAAAIAALRLSMPNVLPENEISPTTALAHVPAEIASLPVLNSDGTGDFLIWHGIRPFIDTRVEIFGDAFPDYYTEIFTPDHAWLEGLIKKYHIAWTMFPPYSPVNAKLAELSGWRKFYADKFVVIFVRSDLPVSGDAENSGSASARVLPAAWRLRAPDGAAAFHAAR